MTSEEYPDLDEDAYELRFTRRGLEDLGCPASTAPGDIDAVKDATQYKDIVEHFRDQRAAHPSPGGDSLHDVGRGDIYSVRGPVGERACTWHDTDAGICWFLGRVAGHDYTEFETRAANDGLLPSVTDYTVLEVEREEIDLETAVGPGIRRMVDDALDDPGEPIRKTVGHLLQLDVTVLAVPVDDDTYRELYITARLPPVNTPPDDWPGGDAIAERLAELATDKTAANLSLDHPTQVPAGDGTERTIDYAAERAIVIRGWDPDDL